MAVALMLNAPTQAGVVKELTFEGVVSTGTDFTGNVFGTSPADLTDKAVTGRFLFDLDAMPGYSYYGANLARYDDPTYPSSGSTLGATGPFARAFITIDGYTHEIENMAQPTLPAAVNHSLQLTDSSYNPWDALSAHVASYRPATCFGCTTAELMTLILTGLSDGFLSGQNFDQDFDVAVNPGNLNSYARFQILSGFQYGATYVPSTPGWGVESFHHATGYVTLSRVALHDLTAVSTVPEPETYGLLLTGLGLIAAIRRRRSHRHPASCKTIETS